MSDSQLVLLGVIVVVSFGLSWIGAAIGSVLGHLRLPLLVYFLGSPVLGASTNMTISGFGALAGSIRHGRAGRISWALVALMGIPSVVGAVLGMMILVHVPRFWGHLTIGTMLLIAGLNLVKSRQSEATEWALPERWRILTEILIGLGIGALASVTGLLLGSLRLPLLIRVLKVDPLLATGSNMVIGCLTAFAAAATAFLKGTEHGFLSLLTLAVVIPPTVLGGYLGARFTDRLSRQQVVRLVGWVVAATGFLMVAQGCWQALATLDLESADDE